MKKHWKKSLVALSMTGMILSLAGCGNGQETQGQNNESQGAEATPLPTAAGTNEEDKQGTEATQTPTPTEKAQGESSVIRKKNPELNTDATAKKELVEGSIARVAVHDPSIFREVDEDGNVVYYVFGTHISSAKSENLVDWTMFTNGYQPKNNTHYGDLSANLKESFAWAGEDDADCKGGYAVWAPDVVYSENYVNEDGSKGAYMIYYSVSSTYCRSAIGYAVADEVEGPYTYKGTLVYSGFTMISSKDNRSDVDKKWTNTNIDDLMAEGRIEGDYNLVWGTNRYNTDYAPNAIDPAIFTDTDGRMWMCYGSWSGGIYLLELDPATGDAIYPGKDGTTEDGRVIDKYFGTRIAGGHTISGEGPFILYDEASDYYYLYTTYNYLDSVSGYNMRLFRAKNPQGPYLDAAGNNAVFASSTTNQYQIGIKVMGNYNLSNVKKGYRSPGHCSAFIDMDGQRYLIYHTRFASGGEGFEVRVHQQFLNEDGWPVTAVFENRNDVISETGYATGEIAGVYEFINHGTGSDGAGVKEPEIVILLEDGTISGDYTGTWAEKDGSYLATFEIAGVTYKGVFFKQHDELTPSQPIMTFTAIGSNNETIWGVKYAEGTEYVEKVVEENGAPSTDFAAVDKAPVLKYTFDREDELEVAGDAKIANGVLSLAKTASSYGKSYAVLPDLTAYDFSEGITISADVLVSKYATDWTPIFMFGDGAIGKRCQSHAYHFTQGFSSVTDDANDQKTGYFGVDISRPYTWDYFSQNEAQNTWHTITVTITASEMKTYINGKVVQSGKDNYGMIMDTFRVATGNYLGGSYYSDPDFCGKLDNVAIYNSCLSEDEVAALAGK
ncbi:MAG: family 43 glycosylhydrolase [Lachnospiraceae bacterium]|nr:family 43 glycosylhydrolase [Lachnospiraceae bacterium]